MNKLQLKTFRGFTLIELLVGLLLILTIGSIVFAIFAATLRGTNKSNSLNALRQGGSQAIDLITKSVRNAKRFDGVSLSAHGTFSDYCLVTDTQTEPIEYKAIKVTTFNDQEEIYRCPVESEQGIYRNNTPLIDTERVVVRPQTSCYFTCTQTATSGTPSIGIHFTLSTKAQTGSSDIDSSLPFQTTVSPRNFIR